MELAKHLLVRAKVLLSSGIVNVSGRFGAGDTVCVIGDDRKRNSSGFYQITVFAEVEKIKGKKDKPDRKYTGDINTIMR